jgi:ABC-type transport system involved in Fe-S cluster assembly fused permease/ATPase subunit
MKRITYLLFSTLWLVVTLSCQDEKAEDSKAISKAKSFEKLSSQHTQINFANTIEETESFNFLYYQYLYNGAGVAVCCDGRLLNVFLTVSKIAIYCLYYTINVYFSYMKNDIYDKFCEMLPLIMVVIWVVILLMTIPQY